MNRRAGPVPLSLAMSSLQRATLRLLALCAFTWAATGAFGQEPKGHEIIDRVESLLWSKTLQGQYDQPIAAEVFSRRNLQKP